MEKKSMRRVVSLGVLLALLIGFMPLLKITTGVADSASPISVRINGLTQTDGKNLSDTITKNKLNSAPINSIEVVSGVLIGADFASISDISQLREITIKTLQPPPTINNAAIFDKAPANRTIRVMSSVVSQYKNANDGNTGDNLWYGFNIVDVPESIMNPEGTATSENDIAGISLTVNAPKTDEAPIGLTKTNLMDKYSVGTTLWSTDDNKAVTKFEQDKAYKLIVELKASNGYKFTADTKLNLTDATHYSPKGIVRTPTISAGSLASRVQTNDTISFTVAYPLNGIAAKNASNPSLLAVGNSVTVDLKSPAAGQTAAGVASTADYSATTTWTDKSGTTIVGYPATIPDTEKFTATIELTSLGSNSFADVATVKTTDTAPAPPFFVADETTIVSKSVASLKFTVTYIKNKVNIADANAKINIASPVGGVAAAVAASGTPLQFDVTSTTWYDNTTAPTVVPIGALFPAEGKYSAVVELQVKEPYVFPPTAKITAISTNGGTQYVQQALTIDSISADGKTVKITIPYAKNDVGCTHTSIIVTGPRVPIPPFESGLTTNAIEARIGGIAELAITKVSCGACYKDVTNEAFFSWRRVNREIPNSPYEALTIREKGKNIYTIDPVKSTDDVYDYYANVTLEGTVDGQNSDYVYLKLGDITEPDPYFSPPIVTCDIGVNQVLRVLSGLPDPQPTRLKYEWRKGDIPANGTPTGPIIYTAYNDSTYTIRNPQTSDEGFYNVTVTNETNGKFKSAKVKIVTRVSPDDLIPILQKDIYVLDFTAPVTGETPVMLKAPADANYTIKHQWRNATSIVAPPSKFAAGKSYIADVTIIPNTGYRMGKVGDSHLEIDVINNYLTKTFKEMGEDGTYCRLEVKFNTTVNPNKQDQTPLEFVTRFSESRTYGDTDFAVAVRGGSGDGAITFTSSDEKVLRIASTSGDSAVISIVGGGEAIITATKASGRDEINFYNPATIASSKITVKPKVLVVKAVDKTIKAGTTTEVFPVSISGFVRGDSEFNLNEFITPKAIATFPILAAEETKTTGTKKKTETETKTPEQLAAEEDAKLDKLCGEYEIIPSGGTPTKAYTFRYVTGTLTVNKSGIQGYPLPNQNYLKSDSYEIEDRKNGIKLIDVEKGGFFVAGTELCVENTTYQITADEKALYNANINSAMGGKQLAQLYDITLKLDGSPIQPKGDVLVDIALANSLKGRYSDLQVVYISDYGDVTIMPHAINSQQITFLTDHFSKYAIIGIPRVGAGSPSGSGTDVPQTSDCSNIFWVAILLAGISGYAIFKVKTEKQQ